MKKICISKDWQFNMPGKNCRVDLPHDYSITMPRSANAPGGGSNGFFQSGVAGYKKFLDLGEAKGHYILDIDGAYMESPHAYVPYQVIDQEFLGVKLEEPSDFCADVDGNIYIADLKVGAVYVIDKNFKILATIKDFVNEWGVRDAITAPSAVFVTPAQNVQYDEDDPALQNRKLYVCDSTQNRILVFDISDVDNITFELTIYQPRSDVFAEGHIFKPIAVAVDKVGRIYTVKMY